MILKFIYTLFLRLSLKKTNLLIYILILCSFPLSAKEGLKNTLTRGNLTCLISTGKPNHQIGRFPNKANPNKFREQTLTFCFPTVPKLTNFVTWGQMTVGVTLNGIPIRPYTADYFDPNTRRGFSKNPSSGWRKQAMFSPRSLGIDLHYGHVDKSGLYHYHRLKSDVINNKEEILIGYAPDGFKIFYKAKEKSSWQLKTGIRRTAPGGRFDGQFEEDFEYIFNSGSLDECNGKKLNGVYTYFATKTYPFFPRCFKGFVNTDFMKRN